jgi:ubiquinone/menaquinone biosynthesis C-methylase UbiE
MNREKQLFFDGISDKWDGWEDIPGLTDKLHTGFLKMGITAEETVMDVGCGTGNLTATLLPLLGTKGRVVAVDISGAMLSLAKEKVRDNRATWHQADAANIPEPNGAIDRVICCSVWPHFDDVDGTVMEFKRLLRQDGMLHVWHLTSKETVNQIHADAGEAVRGDILCPAAETADRLKNHGFDVLEVIDDDCQYLVSARKRN